MPDVLVKPTRHPSPVADRKRRLSIAGIFFPLWLDEKSVQFATRHDILEIASLDDYTKREKDKCWYQKSEYRRMKLTRNLAEKQLGRGKPLPEDQDVACGLECPEDSKLRAICSVHSVRSVLIEQEIQKWETEGDPHQAVSDVYFHSSFACRLDARERALRLERQLTPGRWLPETLHGGKRNDSSHPGDGSSSASSSSNAPAMPIREESMRGSVRSCGFMPVRMPSFSEHHSDMDELLDEESFHNSAPSSSIALPRLPTRRTSLGSDSSEDEDLDGDSDEESWASAQRAASTINLAGSLAI